MHRFAALYAELDRTASTLAKREAIASYLRDAPAGDAAWAVYVLGGGKLRRLATSTELRQALAASTGYADWPGLIRSVEDSRASRIYVTHGDGDTLIRHLRDLGHDAQSLRVLRGTDNESGG